MQKMQKIPKDYKPPEGGDFTTFEDGEYAVKSFVWTSKTDDDAKRPILIKSEKIEGMFARLKWTLVDGKEGPPQSIRLYEMPLLALSFNPDATLPDIPNETEAGEVSVYMQEIQEIVNKSGLTRAASVKGGWANYIEGMEIPGDKFYYFRFIAVLSKSEQTGEISWYRHDWPKGGHTNYIDVLCEILAEGTGGESKFKGARFRLKIPYGIRYNEDEGHNDWEQTDSGKWNSNAFQANKVYEATAPTMFDPFEPSGNLRNLVPYWVEKANGFPMRPLMGYLNIKTASSGFKYYTMDFSQIQPVEFDAPKITIYEQKEDSVKSDEDLDLLALEIFAEILKYLAGSNKPTIVNKQFTPVGIEVAKKYLTPLKDAGHIEGEQVKDMSHAYISGIVSAMLKHGELSEEQAVRLAFCQEKLNLMLIGMDNVLKDTEDDDIPF